MARLLPWSTRAVHTKALARQHLMRSRCVCARVRACAFATDAQQMKTGTEYAMRDWFALAMYVGNVMMHCEM